MKISAKKVLSLLLAASIIVSLLPYGNVLAAEVEVWTESSLKNVFKDDAKPEKANTSIEWIAAKNEYESAQIVLRSNEPFDIHSVQFSDLVSGSEAIGTQHLKYNFVDYVYISGNSKIDPSSMVRSGAGDYPDPLLNAASIKVPARTTQPIWVTVYVPETAAAGSYIGTAAVNTSLGTIEVPIYLEVADVEIPDSKDGAFHITNWAWTAGRLYSNDADDAVFKQYGYPRYSQQWWNLMDIFAESMKEHRINTLLVPTYNLLKDGPGTRIDENGGYIFDWSKFDEYVQFFIDKGVIKRLEGAHLAYQSSVYKQFRIVTLVEDKRVRLVDQSGKGGLDPNNKYIALKKTFPGENKKLTLQFRFMEPQSGKWPKFQVLNGDSILVDLSTGSYAGGPISIVHRLNNNNEWQEIETIQSNSWYAVKIEVDLSQRKYDVSINGILKVSQADLLSPVASVNGIMLGTGGSSIGELYLDEVRIDDAKGNIVYDTFDTEDDEAAQASNFELIEYENTSFHIENTHQTTYVQQAIGSPGEIKWSSRFLPELQAHLAEKGWDQIWIQHVADEPYDSGNTYPIEEWEQAYERIAQYAPGMKTLDAVTFQSVNEGLVGKLDIWVPHENILDSSPSFYDDRQVLGEEVWFYTSLLPREKYLNRFVDQPVYYGRLMNWFAYGRNATGFLHWAWNHWNSPLDGVHVKGDTHIVYPDPDNASLKNSMRQDAMRDGAEDYELFKILEAKNPSRAKELVQSVVPDAINYSRDIDYILSKRKVLVRDAAGGYDATLRELTVDGQALEDFSPEQDEYVITLPEAAQQVPVVDAVANDPRAEVVIQQADAIPGTAIIIVTAYDKEAVASYRIRFEQSGTEPVQPPAAPTGLTAKAGDGAVTLNWTANAEADLAGYSIYQDGNRVASNIKETVYTVHSLMNGKEYTFAISAVNEEGTESVLSQAVKVTPFAAPSSIASLISLLDRYKASGDLSGPLANQLTNSAKQAAHHLSNGSKDQAAKFMHDFLKHLNKDPMQDKVTQAAKDALTAEAQAIIIDLTNK
ncbi:glycoside hydrolase domain-containing protein [Paenibacillus sp. J2TS4]|uniref:glycoside hydrolase domain-containing protein n=1 Tax=Paenibacillus sp. J2TS4 TaxID=2807194 RepID=UPI001AFD2D10|nr:glycoside hydrolase domain-containing protein [Paenibacillus sp. J2TS4]GIP32663.1 hypothetical protein J2TS4_18730 [Paenibacillus sp. J2TS4]